jgi:3-hexulose-6-phosphate synthase/6-phospho-3-hexuloisomerase
MEQALEKAEPGDALVVDGGASPDVILMGGLMSLRLKKRGIAGVVMDGAVRDIDDIVRLQFPVFTRFICPRAGVFAEVGELQTTVCCGRVPVSPGDYVVADVSGVVFVPGARVKEVAGAVERILEKEAFLEQRLAIGESLPEAAAKFRPSAQ